MNFTQSAPLYSGINKPKGRGALILNSKCGKYSSISMLLNKSLQNPASLNRELQHLEPRIKSLENDTYLLRNLVPLGLKEIINQTNEDLVSLKAFFSNTSSNNDQKNENSNENDDSQKVDIDQHLNDLRQRILSRLDSSIESISNSFKNENENNNKQKMNENSKNKNLIDFEEDYLDEIQQLIGINTENINEKKYRIRERIKVIQKNAQKLHDIFYVGSKNDSENAAFKLKEIEEDCKIHRVEISDIKAKISKFNENISNSNKQKVESTAISQNEDLEETQIETIFASNSLMANYSNQIIELKQTIDEIKNEFQNSLKELKEEADQCENESQELTQAIASISSSTEAIENNANNANKLAVELQSKVNQIASKIEQQEYRNSLMAIVNKIKSTNELIAEEIKEIKMKIDIPNDEKVENDANDGGSAGDQSD